MTAFTNASTQQSDPVTSLATLFAQLDKQYTDKRPLAKLARKLLRQHNAMNRGINRGMKALDSLSQTNQSNAERDQKLSKIIEQVQKDKEAVSAYENQSQNGSGIGKLRNQLKIAKQLAKTAIQTEKAVREVVQDNMQEISQSMKELSLTADQDAQSVIDTPLTIDGVRGMLSHIGQTPLSFDERRALEKYGKTFDTLEIDDMVLNENQMEIIAHYFPNIRYFACASANNRSLAVLKRCKQLQSIIFHEKSPITEAGLQWLEKLPLRRLFLPCQQQIEKLFDRIVRFPFLEELHLGDDIIPKELCYRLLQEHTTLTVCADITLAKPTEDELFDALKERSGTVTEIRAVACHNLRDETIEKLVKEYPALETVVLYGAQNLTDEALECLKSLNNLKSLTVYNASRISKPMQAYWNQRQNGFFGKITASSNTHHFQSNMLIVDVSNIH
jgi:hypothetical protein